VAYVRSIVVNHLQSVNMDGSAAIACIYCNYKEKTEQTFVNLIGSLLKQFLQERPTIPDDVKRLYYGHYRRGIKPTHDEITQALQSEIRSYSKTFIVVDALDECSDSEIWKGLLKELRSLYGNINLMITSRYLPAIEREFDRGGMFSKSIRLEIRATDRDVRKYLEGQMFQLANCVSKNMSLQEDIKNDIVKAVDGM
jgi:hypothetical protein